MRKRIKQYRPSAKRIKIESPTIKPKESILCKQFVMQFKYEQAYKQLPDDMLLIHIPNENISSPSYRIHLKTMGLMAGVLDYMVLYTGGIAFIEFKRDKTCKLTKHQQKFILMLKALNIQYLVTCCIEEAITFLKKLKNNR
jgi:hypothetical protein